MYRRIMVPVDGSVFAESALPIATALARVTGATVDLVEVRERAKGPVLGAEPLAGETLGWDLAYLECLVESLHEAGVRRVARHLLEGPVADCLAAHVEVSGPDLVVLATHGRGALSRAWLGSVTDRLIRRSAIPFLMVRPWPEEDPEGDPSLPAESPFGHVLVPLDGSPLAETILDPVLELALLLGSDLTLLRVVEEPFLPSMAFLPDRLRDTGELLREQVAEAGRYLAQVAQRLEERGIRVLTTVALSERPAASILEHARGRPVDLVALSTHGRQGLERTILGSVTDKVVRGSRKPVLVMRPVAVAAGV